MDVNATLREILGNLFVSGGDYDRTLELIEALVDWVASGGFLPTAAESAGAVVLGAYRFCNHYHGGQTSDEYRLFCKTQRLADPATRDADLDPTSEATAVYEALEAALHESWYAAVCA